VALNGVTSTLQRTSAEKTVALNGVTSAINRVTDTLKEVVTAFRDLNGDDIFLESNLNSSLKLLKIDR
jgi:hypothetical protein